ncbi:MAG: Ig-like domain-containing protein [Bacilli bacterium]|nr:Ig-like domain-containing protein [Bacilli bacterium]
MIVKAEDNDISVSETTTGTDFESTLFDVSSGGATNSKYYKLGSASFTSKSTYRIDSVKTISYSITARKFGGPDASQAVISLSLVNGSTTVATASFSPSNTDLNAYNGYFNVTGDTDGVKFVIQGNGTSGGGKGVGISAISFTATSLPEETKTLSSIAVTDNGGKTWYAGQSVSNTDLKVVATYDDDSTVQITDGTGVTITGGNPLVEGKNTISVSYNDGTTTKGGSVSIDAAAARTLSSIAVSGQTTSFNKGDEFVFGGTVTATYDNSDTENVTALASFSGYNLATLGNQTVTVSYTEGAVTKTTTYQITVNSRPGSAESPYTVAQAKAAIDADSGITGVYATGIVSTGGSNLSSGALNYYISEDGTTTTQLEAYKGKGVGGASFSATSDIVVGQKVTITGNLKKYNSTYEFDSNNQLVSKYNVESVVIKTAPTVTEYDAGEPFAPAGLALTVTWEDGSSKDYSYTDYPSLISYPEGALSANDESIAISIFGESVNQAITVNPVPAVTSVSVAPTEIELDIGETQQLVPTVTVEAGAAQTVSYGTSDASVASVSSTGLITALKRGTATITVTSTVDDTKSATCEVTVIDPDLESFDWDLTTNSYASASESEVVWNNSNAGMTLEKLSSAQNANNYIPTANSSTRFYNGQRLTIAPVSGVKIDYIEFTATTAAYANALANTSTWTNGTATVDDKKVTVEATNGANSLICAVKATSGISSVQVYYKIATLTDVTVSGVPTHATQYAGIAFDPAGLIFTANYSDGSNVVLDGENDIEWNALVVGQNPTGIYAGQSVTVTSVTVLVNSLVSIAISGDLSNDTFALGGSWDPAGLAVTATYDVGSADVTDDVEWSYSPAAPNSTSIESVTITATYNGETHSKVCSVTVVESYTKVTSENNLYAGMKVVLGYGSEKAAGALNSSYLTSVDASINGNSLISAEAVEFTIGGTVGAWTLTSEEGTLQTTAAKTVNYNNGGTNTWDITFSGEDVLIADTSDYGTMKYNTSSPRFTTYASGQAAIQLYAAAPENNIYSFISNYMRMGDVDLKGDGSGACTSNGYYSAAKAAFNNNEVLSAQERAAFFNESNTQYAAARLRLIAWAVANGDKISDSDMSLVAKANTVFRGTDATAAGGNNGIICAAIIVATGIVAVGGFAFIRRKKEDR